MNSNYVPVIGYGELLPYTLAEAIKKHFVRDSWKSNLAHLLLRAPGLKSSRAELKWKLRILKSGRLYFQLAICFVDKNKGSIMLLPTPTASDGVRGRSRKLSIVDGKLANISNNGTRYGITIRQLVEEGFLPTPLSRTARASCKINRGKGNLEDLIAQTIVAGLKSPKINPDFISEMMGFPISWLQVPFI